MIGEDPFIGNLLVDTIDAHFEKQRLNVEFAFVLDTTVETVLTDLEEALAAMDLRLIVPRAHCALAFDSNASANATLGGAEVPNSLDAALDVFGSDVSGPVLTGRDRIFAAPEVEAFYSLNRRCGLSRTATFLVVRHTAAEVPQQHIYTLAQQQPSPRSPSRLAALLLPRPLQESPAAAAAYPYIHASAVDHSFTRASAYDDRGIGGLRSPDMDKGIDKALLAHVRSLVAAESATVTRGAGHWSVRLCHPPARRDWLSAVDAESAACERLAARFAEDAATAAAHRNAAVAALQSEISELHERVDGAKAHVARRAALQNRAAELKAEVDAQREKERELLRAMDHVRSPSGLGAIPATNESHFMSHLLREEVRRALSPQRGAADMRRLRQLAAELGQHLRAPNPSAAERQRLMGEIRQLRMEVEQQRAGVTSGQCLLDEG